MGKNDKIFDDKNNQQENVLLKQKATQDRWNWCWQNIGFKKKDYMVK